LYRGLWVERGGVEGGGGLGSGWVVIAELALVNVVSRRFVIGGLTGAAVVAVLIRFNCVRSVNAVRCRRGSWSGAESLVAGRGLHAVRGARWLAHFIGIVAHHVATAREKDTDR